MNVGIVGCGVISRRYLEASRLFESFEIVACADVDSAQAATLGPPVMDVGELIAADEVELILNLTPAAAHAEVSWSALAAGKHVYTEKPIAVTEGEGAELLAEAAHRGLRIGCAPDTFLGRPYQLARALIDAGHIGEPISVSASMLTGAHEASHPNPDIFFVDGAGPLLDMGPYYLTALGALLGPIASVSGFASIRKQEREILVGSRAGARFRVETPTHVAATMGFGSGATASMVASFEVNDQYHSDLQIHGTEGILVLPDPNSFDGPLRIRYARGNWQEIPVEAVPTDTRGLGLHDLVESISTASPHRASGELAVHVVEVARGILAAADQGQRVEIVSSFHRPSPRWTPAMTS